MSAFEFFFSFYGLVLGLSVAVIATGVATSIQHRHKIQIGWLTPLLALFVGLDIATFWDSAWNTFRDAPFSYGMLVVGLTIALFYFIAASLVFPHEITEGASLDDHFWANKKVVLLLTTVANILMVLASVSQIIQKPDLFGLLIHYGTAAAFYVALIVPAALTHSKRLFAALVGLNVVIYFLLAALSFVPGTPRNS
jgi:hypothetical protein